MPSPDSRSIFETEVLPLFEAVRGGWIARARDAARRLATE